MHKANATLHSNEDWWSVHRQPTALIYKSELCAPTPTCFFFSFFFLSSHSAAQL